jgi:hypothetical protein
MNRLDRHRTLIAGLALIVLTNAVVLAGVAYNRSGEPEATLRLTERELGVTNYGMWAGEKSGIGLNLQWRLPRREADRSSYFYGFWGGEAAWLDEAKLRELGFEPPPPGLPEERRGRREKERAVTLVLEYDGPAYQAVLKLAQEAAAKERAGGGKPKGAYDSAVEWLEREERSGSRLFAVDAGLDADALRAKYPDRGRYAIAEGRVRPYYRPNVVNPKTSGHVTAVSVPSINVPLEYRSLFAPFANTPYHLQQKGGPRYEATLSYGKRLEPHLTGAKRLPN